MKKKDAVLGAILLAVFAGLLVTVMYNTNSFPMGSDVYGHLFKIQVLHEEISKGNWFPLYIKNWYSGSELFRYSSPLSYYIVSLLMFATGNIYTAYIVFVGIIYLIGAAGWLLFGIRERRPYVASALGIIYMILPDNMRVFYEDGNIPRMMITMLLPLFFFFIFDYIHYDKKRALIPINILIIVITYTHIMVAVMLSVAVLLVCIVYSIIYKEIKRECKLLFDIALGYAISGVILVPSMVNGVIKQTPTAAVEKAGMWSQLAIVSLNPFTRFSANSHFYFGLSLFLLIIIGLIAMRKETAPGFLVALVIFFSTTFVAIPFLSVIGLEKTDWMRRAIPIAEVVTLVSLLYWRKIKNKALCVILLVIALDSAFSLSYITKTKEPVENKQSRMEEESFFDEACAMVDNRLAIMDLNLWESYPAYAIVKGNRDVDSLVGWSDQGVFTTKEIATLNDAFAGGYYYYVFDRLYMYGCDTVIIYREALTKGTDELKLIEAASEKGYSVIEESEETVLFKNEGVSGQYGVYENYENVCIGDGAEYISFLYPSFYKLTDESLDDYTFEDLKGYKKIFLSGPTYEDKTHAEDLVWKLSEAGVQIFIDMNNLQDDKPIGRNSFLGVVAQPITFTNAFPIIEKSNGSQFKLPYYSEKYGAWRTVYFTNLEHVTRRTEYSRGKFLDYLGTSPNEHITFIGLNLVYYCKENPSNENLYQFLDEIFDESRTKTPDHGYVPINVTVDKNTVKIVSPKDGVMTSVANLKSFVSERDPGKERFVKVDKGATKLRLKRAYLTEGSICTILGILITLYFWKMDEVWKKEEEY